MAQKQRLVLLDTHAILHRAYHALPDFSSSKGEPTGALYGLISILVRLVGDLKPDYIVAAYDLPGPTHRHLVYEGYKATRPKTQDDLVAQIQRSRDVLAAFGIPLYEEKGFEADDIIGTAVEKLKKQKDLEVIIASGDMDTLQLIEGERVRVYTMRKGLTDVALFGEAEVRARYGFGPSSVPDLKGIAGDASDNIKGVPGVGEGSALKLLSAYGDLKNLYAAIKKEGVEGVAEKTGVQKRFVELVAKHKKDAEFSKELATIERHAPIRFELPENTWQAVADPQRALDLVSELEFRSLLPRVKDLFGLKGKIVTADSGQASLLEPAEQVPEEEWRDMALAVWVLDSSITGPTLDDIYRIGESRVFAQAKKNILADIQERGLQFVYEEIERPLAPVLRHMEERGLLIDRGFLAELSKDYHKKLDALASRVYKHAGQEFNINSPRQLSEVLFDKLGLALKNHKKTSTGVRSTRESELEKMRELHPIVGDVLEYREFQKLLSTYIDNIPELLDSRDRLHTTFVQTGTSTGRLASQNPNLQNIPIKSDLGRAIRRAFVAPKGFTLLSFDYSQIELRIAAILSGDEALGDIFRRGEDVHSAVAARVFGVAEKDVTYEQRRRAKVINFGILYGMGVNALQQGLGTSRKEAQEFYDNYFKTFSTLAQYLEDTKADAARRGYTETLFGRRRYFEGIRSSIPYVRAAAERMAINAPMQGTQSDIVKLAMIRIDELFAKEAAGKAYLLLQVHDELLFEIENDLIGKLAPKIQRLMEDVLSQQERRGIPVLAKGMAGKNWGEMKAL